MHGEPVRLKLTASRKGPGGEPYRTAVVSVYMRERHLSEQVDSDTHVLHGYPSGTPAACRELQPNGLALGFFTSNQALRPFLRSGSPTAADLSAIADTAFSVGDGG